jgi:hypothetical protein
MDRLPFKEVWCGDTEFSAPDGERPRVRCLAMTEFYTRRTIHVWLDGEPTPDRPPFDIGPDSLFIAYFASAELGSFLSLGWSLPTHVIDLYTEFKWLICGRDGEPNKPSLVYALDWFGLPSLDVTEKQEMRQLAIRDGPHTPTERNALLDYCGRDVDALIRLLPRMLPKLDLPRAVHRGEFVRAIAWMEHHGVPIDVPTLAQLGEHWGSLRNEMVRRVDAAYGIFDGIHFRADRFGRWLASRGIAWPRLDSGELSLSDGTFRDMVPAHPELQPLQQLRQALAMLHLSDLPVGHDGRNRCLMSPYGSSTGRCTPSTMRFIFGRPSWMRSLIRPERGRALAYVDWSSQEFGIGAILSGDPSMTAAYESGDPYLSFAKRIGLVPDSATKKTHRAERDLAKLTCLATQYGISEITLATRINKPPIYARNLLAAHHAAFRKYWQWTEAAVNTALFRGRLWTRFGWQTHTGANPNPRSLANFPCQANGADMLRLAAGCTCDAGVQLDATVHDALLVEADADDIDTAVDRTRRAMDRASELVLSGFRLRTEAEVIRFPSRYRDDRGSAFFDELLTRLQSRLNPGHRRQEAVPEWG